MSELQEFSWKPALLRAAIHVTVGPAGVSRDGETLPWDRVQAARYSRLRSHGLWLHQFELVHDARAFVLPLTSAEAPGQGARGAWEAAVAAICEKLPAHGVDEVQIGRGGRQGLILFGLGLVTFLGALGLIGAAIASGASPDRLAAAAVPFGLLLLLGAWLTWAHRPGRALPRVPAGLAPRVIAALG